MHLTLNKKELRLKDLLMEMPPELEKAAVLLKQDGYTAENISKVGNDFVGECIEECWDLFLQNDIARSEDVIPGLHSTHLCEVLSLLLSHGLDPNGIFEDSNIMDDLKYLDNGYMAADALVLLFEHGGDPNLRCNGDTIFNEIDYDLFFDALNQPNRQRYASLVHCWMVHLAFGALYSKSGVCVHTSQDFGLAMLKDHRRFYFGLSEGDGPWPDIRIFRKADMWEVVRAFY